MSLSTHVLDATRGVPAAGMRVRLYRGSTLLADLATDADGRIRDAFPQLEAGVYRLLFETAGCFYPEVAIAFTVDDPARHYHVPLLLSPFAYSTYRGS
jgi:5-hydroxyisourate hydrolase